MKKDIEAYKRPFVHVTARGPQLLRLRRVMLGASIGARPVSPVGIHRMEARFTVISGPFRAQTFQVPRGKFILDRETDCHLVLDSHSVSRHHCVLLMDDYTLRIRDLASRNGTFVNRDQTRTGERILVNGDTVRVGDLAIGVELESGTGSTPAAALETQDVGPETIDHAGHSPENRKVDEPTSAEGRKQHMRTV
jgi:predicted component of type VI protein secretion system